MGRRMIGFLLGLGLLLSGCASMGLQERISKLEAEVSTLKSQVRIAMAGGAAGSGQMRWRPGRTGGGDSLDGIACSGMAEGYVVVVPTISGTDARFYLYVWDDDSTATESDPTVIKPDDSDANCSGAGRWRLASIYGPGFIGSSADGTRYMQAVNTIAFSGTPAEGMCYYKTSTSSWCCYDTDSWNCHVIVDND